MHQLAVARGALNGAGARLTVRMAGVAVAGLLVSATPLAGALRTTGGGDVRGGEARTSFGKLVLERATRAPMAKSPFATKHDPVGPHKVEVRVRVAVVNTLETAIVYSPGQFRLRLNGSGVTIAAREASASAVAAVPPGKRIHSQLTFIAPRTVQRMSLDFEDLGRARPVRFDLGRVPVSGKHDHRHGTHEHTAGG